jgi:hypothetical protein
MSCESLAAMATAICGVRFTPILLKNSIFSNGQNLPDALVRSSKNYMGRHMSSQIFNRQAS